MGTARHLAGSVLPLIFACSGSVESLRLDAGSASDASFESTASDSAGAAGAECNPTSGAGDAGEVVRDDRA